MLEDIINTLDQLGIDKVHYLGESTAGIFGDFLAAKYPHRMHSVTICGSPLVLNEAARKSLSYGYTSCVESIKQLGARGWGEHFLGVAATDKGAIEGYIAWWLDKFSIPSKEGLCDYATVVCSKEADGRVVMDQIDAPLLLLTPAHSALVDIEDQKRLAAAAKKSRMELIPGHGHEIYIDQAGLCQQKLLDFLRGLAREL